MAQTPSPILSFFLVLALLLSFTSVSNSIRDHQHNSYQIFDVSAVIQKTHQVFTQTPQAQQEEEAKPTITATAQHNSSVLSFSLHPRASVKKPQHKDYSSLTRARIARDSAQVNSLNSKLEFALSGYTQADLKPVPTAVQPEDLETPLTSGVSQGSGEYFARMGVGRPGRSYYMVIDTGSDLSWLQCQPCADCYQQTDPMFDPSSSSTYRTVSCSAQECSQLQISGCSDGKCIYQINYGDGSYTMGDLATDTVSFGNSGSVSDVPIGCGHDNVGLFVGAAGLVGLARAPLSLPGRLRATSFSYCLVNRDSSSSSTLDFNSAPPGDSVFASMVRNPKLDLFYYLDMVGINVGGETLSIPASVFQVDGNGRGGVIVDSGTAVTRLNTQAYNALRDAFKKYASDLPSSSGFSLFDTCYDFSSVGGSVRVPTVSFLFASGKRLSLKPSNYLVPVDGRGKFCLAFAPTSSLSIIGNVQQQGTRVSFDLANRQFGFSPNKC
ncbi:protein ASPARTIC PROTEASE IN GUARD CELL 1-like [Coffea arabica]|uniref:Protein ASPARTIC PROTEASE IN GUARD CELL 1-like n=1 Tax=Coffea arabica TaxID=13443 RepID=A0ABM4U3I3_COFAR